jgi:hypothetical protein
MAMASSEATRNLFLIITMTLELLFLCGYLYYLPLTKDNPIGIATVITLILAILITGCFFRQNFYYNRTKLIILLVILLLIAMICCALGIIRWLPMYVKYLENDSMLEYWNHRMNKDYVQNTFRCCGPTPEYTNRSNQDAHRYPCPYTTSCQQVLKAEYYLLQEISGNLMLILSLLSWVDFFVIIFTSRVSPTTKRNLDMMVPDRVIILDSFGNQMVGSSSIQQNLETSEPYTQVEQEKISRSQSQQLDRSAYMGKGSLAHFQEPSTSSLKYTSSLHSLPGALGSEVVYPDTISEISGASHTEQRSDASLSSSRGDNLPSSNRST